MKPEELYQILHAKPFQPFRVHLNDGRFYDIRYQRLAVVGKTFFAIGVPMPDQEEPFYDYVDHVDWALINRIEMLPNAASTISHQ